MKIFNETGLYACWCRRQFDHNMFSCIRAWNVYQLYLCFCICRCFFVFVLSINDYQWISVILLLNTEQKSYWIGKHGFTNEILSNKVKVHIYSSVILTVKQAVFRCINLHIFGLSHKLGQVVFSYSLQCQLADVWSMALSKMRLSEDIHSKHVGLMTSRRWIVSSVIMST